MKRLNIEEMKEVKGAASECPAGSSCIEGFCYRHIVDYIYELVGICHQS